MSRLEYYYPTPPTKNFELVCPNDGPSYFETEYANSFYVKCHLCEWREPNPEYYSEMPDEVMLRAIDDRTDRNADPPDHTLRFRYSQTAIYSKLEELYHRDLLVVGVSLRCAWISDAGKTLLDGSLKS